MDSTWVKEFDQTLDLAATRRLIELLDGRARAQTVAAGPGAARLHPGLDAVNAEAQTLSRAQLADGRTLAMLLHEQFPELHFGTLNHCL